MNPYESVLAQLLRWRFIDDGEMVRLIYVDEAGTGPAEPVRVVASVIVHGDKEARILTSELERINRERVPESLQQDYIFHAKEVFNGGKRVDRSIWGFDDRLDYLKEIVSLPFVHDIPIAVGLCFKGVFDDIPDDDLKTNGVSRATFEHGIAFSNCVKKSDSFLRKYLNGNENGMIIAEDVPSNKKFLGDMAMRYRSRPLTMRKEHIAADAAHVKLGEEPEPYTYTINNISDVPHFVAKDGAPLLQLADACAFSFRRYLSKQEHGADLILAMLGSHAGRGFINDPIWFSGVSSGLFNAEKYFSEEQIKTIQEKNNMLAIGNAITRMLRD